MARLSSSTYGDLLIATGTAKECLCGAAKLCDSLDGGIMEVTCSVCLLKSSMVGLLPLPSSTEDLRVSSVSVLVVKASML